MEPDSQASPSSPSISQFHRHHRQHQFRHTSPRPASAASYYSPSSSSSPVDNPRARFPKQPSTLLRPITTHNTQPGEPEDFQNTSPSSSGSHQSSLNFGSTTSLIDGLSGLTIQNEEPPASQLTTSQTRLSSSIEYFSSSPSSSLEEALSQFALEQDRPSFPRVTTAGIGPSWQPNTSRTVSSRPVSEVSYDSSSSEGLSSARSQWDDDVFSQTANEDDETPQSSQSTTEGAKSFQLGYQEGEPSECSDLSILTTPVREPEEAVSPVYVSPSSTGKLSYPSPIHSSAHSIPSSPTQSPESSRSPRSPRLYRTRSGSLASVAELRRLRQLEEEQLDIVLRGIRKVQRPPLRRFIDMSLDEGGRWRIHSIYEPMGP